MAVSDGSLVLSAFNGFLLGVNAMLALVQPLKGETCMTIFSKNWTGRREENFAQPTPKAMSGGTEVLERPAIKSAPALTPRPTDARETAWLDEYVKLAAEVGIRPPEIKIEEFKQFLNEHDIPVFALSEVVRYMDDKAEKESAEKAGWQWRPLRSQDHRFTMHFGRAARWVEFDGSITNQIIPSSDYYVGLAPSDAPAFSRMLATSFGDHGASGPISVYDRTIPLHALRKVALINKHWKGDVALFVSDYAPAPEIRAPDPFLMAVIPNPNAHKGEGRFVIDFWDEPGFGIDKMLAK
jgi:hypothetical protein